MNALISSSEMTFSKVTTHGERVPYLPSADGRLIARGLYCGKSRMMRVYVASMSCASTAGGVSGGRLHALRFASHFWQLVVQCSCMYGGFFSHSPA